MVLICSITGIEGNAKTQKAKKSLDFDKKGGSSFVQDGEVEVRQEKLMFA